MDEGNYSKDVGPIPDGLLSLRIGPKSATRKGNGSELGRQFRQPDRHKSSDRFSKL
jgi:hypothetical protein